MDVPFMELRQACCTHTALQGAFKPLKELTLGNMLLDGHIRPIK